MLILVSLVFFFLSHSSLLEDILISKMTLTNLCPINCTESNTLLFLLYVLKFKILERFVFEISRIWETDWETLLYVGKARRLTTLLEYSLTCTPFGLLRAANVFFFIIREKELLDGIEDVKEQVRKYLKGTELCLLPLEPIR